jgi:carbamoyl-phosphate synthase small subunit
VIRDLPLLASNFRNEQSLSEHLIAKNVIGIADIDTRRLTRILRDKGAQNGCIMAGWTMWMKPKPWPPPKVSPA